MKYSVAAVLALAATSVSAWYNDTIVYTTEVVDVYTTVCPASGTITYEGSTYTNTATESAYITISCSAGCTISKPIYTTSSVICNSCAAPTTAPAPVYPNATAPVPTSSPEGAAGTTYTPVTPPTTVPVSGASKLGMSGAGLAGLLVLAAYL